MFEATSPTGPFAEREVPRLAVNAGIPPGVNNGDHDLFADEDGTGYLAYTDWRRGGDIVVERLDDDWLSGTGDHVRLGVTATEAPSMFRRGERYYITLSDPNCGYCTTGTSYFTAEAPLGPWRGRAEQDSWRIEQGELLVDGGGIGLSRAGADWTDYDLSFSATPLATGDGGAYAQAGWVFRATSPGDGYAWLLGNYPHPGAEGGNLTKVVFRGGGVASAQVVKLPFAVEAGRRYAIETRLRGDRVTTLVDGRVVDETVDPTHPRGRVGFRESGVDTESARFDDVRVTAPDGAVLLADAFDGDLAAWDRPAPRQRGIRISENSCGGQPADVAALPGRAGKVYLFQSDRWNNGQPNEALATHYWEPLRFDDDGSDPAAALRRGLRRAAGRRAGRRRPPTGAARPDQRHHRLPRVHRRRTPDRARPDVHRRPHRDAHARRVHDPPGRPSDARRSRSGSPRSMRTAPRGRRCTSARSRPGTSAGRRARSRSRPACRSRPATATRSSCSLPARRAAPTASPTPTATRTPAARRSTALTAAPPGGRRTAAT